LAELFLTLHSPIVEFYRRLTGRQERLEEDNRRLRGEEQSLRRSVTALEEEGQRQARRGEEQARRNQLLDGEVADRDRQTAALQAEVERLSRQVEDARAEIEAIRHRSETDSHLAYQERDTAVTTFKADLWERLQRCFVEVMNEGPEEEHLNSDQRALRRRLREIRDTLRAQGVPPY
jgi:hypothetical protein